ncbi:MAG TPA: NAD(P)-dependent oxidoreductase [Acidothermaceae bacterium]
MATEVTDELTLITGAAGRIGGYLRAGRADLGGRLRFFDRVRVPGESDSIVADICDQAALDAAMEGVTAVVHLAASLEPEDPYEVYLHSNFEGTYRVFDAAQRAGVRRIVFASSNHANGFAPRSDGAVAGSVPDRPDGIYGVSKLYGEALGRLFHDRYGLEVVCLRIGSCFDQPSDPRMLGSWLSPADVVRLVAASLQHPVGYAVVYGISNNTRRWWDLGPAQALGYRPRDNGEDYAEALLAQYGGVDPSSPHEPQGGMGAWIA